MAEPSVNKVILLGRLADHPDFRNLASGTALCRLRLVTNESYKDSDGEWAERPSYHTVTLWGRTAEVADQYLSRGSQVYIEGSLQTRKWKDRDDNTRWSTEVRGRRMVMCGGQESSRRDSRSHQEEESGPGFGTRQRERRYGRLDYEDSRPQARSDTAEPKGDWSNQPTPTDPDQAQPTSAAEAPEPPKTDTDFNDDLPF